MYKRREFTEEETNLSATIRVKLEEVEELLNQIPNCRNKSIALTHIEDAMLRANLAITESGLVENK